jgi:hypothetical protein
MLNPLPSLSSLHAFCRYTIYTSDNWERIYDDRSGKASLKLSQITLRRDLRTILGPTIASKSAEPRCARHLRRG